MVVGEDASKQRDIQRRLGGAQRCLAHVATDKPIYRTGESVYVRAVVVDALTRAPWMTNGMAQVEIISPKGDTIARGMASVENGSLGYQWPIDESVAGGDYKVKVSFPNNGYPPAERGFNIRAFRQRRLRTQIEFAREGYGPSDEVTATLQVSRSEGGIPVGAKASVVARVDQREVWQGTTTVDASGFATVRFKLPQTIVQGDGTLSFAIEDGGVVETAAKTIPILVATVDLKAYPEGGDLVAGLENRIYFESIAPNGRPADIVAQLVDSKKAVILQAKTEHEGRGSFVFTPQADTTYTLEVIEPWIVTTRIDLPRANRGVTLRATKERYAAGEPIEIEVGWSEALPNVRVVVSNREVAVANKTIQPTEEKSLHTWASVPLDLPKEIAGILRITLYDNNGRPRAERLIYREPADKMNVAFELDRQSYIPGGKVTLKVKTTDAAGNPVAGFVGLTVSDDAVLEMIETREKAPRLPVQVYIEPEVRELADAHVYLSNDPKAPRALDLLLGTQGWRRFAFFNIDEFLKIYGDAARRVLAEMQRPVPQARVFGLARGGMVLDAALPEGVAFGERAKVAADARDKKAELNLGVAEQKEKAGMREIRQDPAAKRLPLQPAATPMPARPAAPPPIAARIVRPGAGRQAMADEALFEMELQQQLIAVRVYAHTVRPNRQPNDRVDFAETLYWNAGIATNDKGEASVSFDLCDSVSSFRAMADGYTKTGSFGSADAVLESRQPFYVEVKAPLETTTGDEIRMPVVLVNETDNAMESGLVVSANAGVKLGQFTEKVKVPAHSRTRVIVPANVENKAGLGDLIVSASAGEFSDSITRKITAKPLGFPIALNFGGVLEGKVSHAILIPKTLTEGGMTAQAVIYPTPLGNLTKALEALVRDPCGCFEQASSSNYPLVMGMQYFETHTGVDPALITRSRDKLAAGYKLLTGYECKQKGYEWFGGDPGHEALSAYGLLEFTDMAQVHPVDPQMMERTREWLMKRRDGKGGFERNARALDSFGGAPPDITNAYITWALACAKEKDIAKELDAIRDAAGKSDDPYLIALAAGALIESDRKNDAAPLLKRLATMQDKDGSIKGAKTSITRSGGVSLLVETTALSVLAWLSDGAYAGNTEKAMKWLCQACEGGRFGSTQSTVLALKAIIAYDKSRARPKADGTLILSVDGNVLESLDFKKTTEGALEFRDFAGTLLPGEHVVTLEMKDGSPMPYSLAVEYTAEKPADAKGCPLEIQTRITEASVAEGNPVEIVARVRNTKDAGLPMTMVIVGLPGGLEPRHEQLKEAVKAGKFSFYEIRGREVAIYFRDLPPKAEREIVISALASVPGTYVGPASRAYLYYTPEEKKWTDGLRVTVTPK
jgi:hypothetical protein